jgi:hypothetical protein
MLSNSCYRWPIRAAATTAAVLLAGAALSVWSAEVPAPAGSAAPAEIPEPASDLPATKKARKPKAPTPDPAAKSAEMPKPASAPAAASHQTGPQPSAPAAVARSAEEPKPAAEPAAVESPKVKDEDVQPPFVKNAEKNWYVSLSFDDYWFNVPITEGSGGTQSGNLYGGSLSFAPPAWQGKTYFDFSMRQGFLRGDTSYRSPFQSSLDTFVNEVSVGFHFESLPWMLAGKERGHVLSYVGLSWDGWNTTETLWYGRTWASTKLPTLTTDMNMILANVGLGYDLVLWNTTSKWMSYRLGVRAEAIGAVGGSLYNMHQGEQIESLALYGLARGTAYMDLTFCYGVGVFIEAGYQQSWWFFSEKPADNPGVNQFPGYYGGFGRVGVAFHF